MPKAKKQQKPLLRRTFRIFCEGEKTEPYYINGYLRHFREDNRAFVEVMDCKKNTPVQLVDAAIKFKNSNRSVDGDVFWVVYDREAVAKYDRALHQKAWGRAKKNNIKIALSNVCFEYWLLLHFVDSAAAFASFDDLKKNSPLFAEVTNLCGKKYDKASAILFDHIKDKIVDARGRAKIINKQGMNAAGEGQCMPFDINPYTNMPNLLIAIDNFVA